VLASGRCAEVGVQLIEQLIGQYKPPEDVYIMNVSSQRTITMMRSSLLVISQVINCDVPYPSNLSPHGEIP